MFAVDPDLFTIIIQFELDPMQQRDFAHDLVDAVERSIATLLGPLNGFAARSWRAVRGPDPHAVPEQSSPGHQSVAP